MEANPHCIGFQIIDHYVSTCKWLQPQKETLKIDLGKKPLGMEQLTPKQITHQICTKESGRCGNNHHVETN